MKVSHLETSSQNKCKWGWLDVVYAVMILVSLLGFVYVVER